MRCHILPTIDVQTQNGEFFSPFKLRTLDPVEIFAGKIVAFSRRGAPRDLYDVNNMLTHGIFAEKEIDLLRKCFVFYSAVAGDHEVKGFDLEQISNITQRRIKTDLLPVIRKSEHFDLSTVKNTSRNLLGRE